MASAYRLQKLHTIRRAEEELKKSALAEAIQELHRLENALRFAHERCALGRTMMNAGAESGQLEERIVGREEVSAADRSARFLISRVRKVEENIKKFQTEFLAKRVQRRQVQKLLESAIAEDVVTENRKSQADLDEWHRSRHSRHHLEDFQKS